MVARLPLFMVLFLLLAIGLIGSVPILADDGSTGENFLSQVQAALDAGDLSPEDALLIKFQYLFAPDLVPAEFDVQDMAPLKCGTSLVREFQNLKSGLSARLPGAALSGAMAEISTFLQPLETHSTALSPQGRFQLSYSLIGENAVPAEDVAPANGIPDFVDRVGNYLDQAWETEIQDSGFTPPVSPGGPYPVSFQEMAAYGYTIVVDQGSGATRMVLHNNYEWFPPNDDPIDERWGAAKVTAAHELKHASQYATSRWCEGGWIELDAVWAEELVFDEVNDYYNFLFGDSPLRRPDLCLDSGITNSGSYEDAVFQIWLEQTWGVEIIQDFWSRRPSHPEESVMTTWEQVLAERGVSLAQGWAQFTAWNYATDQRAVPQVGYDEATDYPHGLAVSCAVGQPFTFAGEVDHLAGQPFRLDGFTDVPDLEEWDRLEIVLQGSHASSPLTLAVHVTKWDGTGWQETAVLNGAASLTYLVSVPWAEIKTAGLIVGNAAKTGSAIDFELAFRRVGKADQNPFSLNAGSFNTRLGCGETSSHQLILSHQVTEGSAVDFSVEFFDADPCSGDSESPEAAVSVPWLTCDPTQSSLLPGEEAILPLEFSAAGLSPGAYSVWLGVRALKSSGLSAGSDIVQLAIPVTLVVTDPTGSLAGEGSLLRGSFPNPFNPETWIRYVLPSTARVQIDVLDLRGRVVRRLLDETRESGSYKQPWNGCDDQGAPLGAGLYLARLRCGGQQFTCKMVLAK